MLDNTEAQIFLDIVIASILTMVVGIEREKANKAAGIRTNMIVSGFTCLIISIQPALINFIQNSFSNDLIDIDPIRVLQAVIVGLSFIGAGTIIKSPNEKNVTGLTICCNFTLFIRYWNLCCNSFLLIGSLLDGFHSNNQFLN